MTTTTAAAPPSLSYELYPPRAGVAPERIQATVEALEATQPDYVSVTCNGSPARRRASLDFLRHLMHETRLRPVAHLTCVGETRRSLDRIVRELLGLGVRGVLALRGDLPTEPGVDRGELPFARYLVELIRDVELRHGATLAGGRLSVGVAAYPDHHPESPSFQHDLEVLLAKERSGADFAITQVYFEPDRYGRLVAAARRAGVTIPIVPGIIPFDSERRLERLAQLTGLAPDPRLLHRLATASDDRERRRIGVDAALRLARAAFDDGAPGLHLYTFNDHRGSLDVVEALGLAGTAHRAAAGVPA